MNPTICKAVRDRHVLEFTYQGHHRVVEPHAHGLSHARHEVLRCYQTDGTSGSGMALGWRIVRLDRIRFLTVTPRQFSGVRDGYRRGDTDMSPIFCEL